MRFSLRTQGMLAVGAVVLYLGVVGLILDHQRQHLLQLAGDLERLSDMTAALGKAANAISNTLMRAQELLLADSPGSSAGDDVALDVELVQAGLHDVRRYFPEFGRDIAELGHVAVQLRRHPSRGGLTIVKDTARLLDQRLTAVDTRLRAERAELWAKYHDTYDTMTVIGVTLHLIGLVAAVALMLLVSKRLAGDIGRVKNRAAAIVEGYRGPPLKVTRADEIGTLMHAVNQMQTDLREREGKLEIAREQHSHREKMAALGSLASAVAHEVNNPIAAIAGVAQAMVADLEAGRHATGGDVADCARLILEQTQRISAISRQIGEYARPRDETPELIDINALVRRTSKFLRYDQRLRHVEIELALDDDVPAVLAVADHCSQVLINLLINAGDAMAEATDREPRIRIATSHAPGEVRLTVSDNGHGMDEATLARAFDESFTTKPADIGRGLGLFMCKSLVERGGGRIELASVPGAGTTATVRLPLAPQTLAGAT